MNSEENKKMFRARFDIFVLNALADKNGASYGYDVINYIQTKTKGHYKIKTFSTIYNTLKRLEEQGFVVSGKGDGETNGAARVYYTLTDEGKEYLEDNKQEYKYLRTLLDNLLTDEDFDLDNEVIPYNASTLKPLTKRTSRSDTYTCDADIVAASTVDAETLSEGTDLAETDVNVGTTAKMDMSAPLSVTVTPTPIISSSLSKPKKTYNPTAYKAVFERIATPVITSGSKTKKSSSDISTVKTKSSTTKESSLKHTGSSARQTTDFVSDRSHVETLKRTLQSEGYTLTTYGNIQESVSSGTSSKHSYVYINKLLRDSVVLSALYFIACSLFLYLMRDTFLFSLKGMIVCIAVSLVIALISFLIWFRNPEKKRKDGVRLKVINCACIVFFTVFFLLDLIVYLLSVRIQGGLRAPAVYTPVLLASVSVLFGVFFSLLYKSERYSHK